MRRGHGAGHGHVMGHDGTSILDKSRLHRLPSDASGCLSANGCLPTSGCDCCGCDCWTSNQPSVPDCRQSPLLPASRGFATDVEDCGCCGCWPPADCRCWRGPCSNHEASSDRSPPCASARIATCRVITWCSTVTRRGVMTWCDIVTVCDVHVVVPAPQPGVSSTAAATLSALWHRDSCLVSTRPHVQQPLSSRASTAKHEQGRRQLRTPGGVPSLRAAPPQRCAHRSSCGADGGLLPCGGTRGTEERRQLWTTGVHAFVVGIVCHERCPVRP